ncbi:hypothetical protein [Amaricoccus solimangrovi]|uniref:hypothetical protein n=1 Tax=Amaricoccus solimangrovi TaxID=2589815 RepID=UPI0015E3CC06|nr:hypothetical protein [Amaricoccus solimangrovi]
MLIAVMIIGLPWFPRRERPPIPVTDVSFVSEADFERAQAAARGPRDEAAPPEQVRAEPSAPEPAARPPEPAPRAEAPPAPQTPAEPPAETAPETPAPEVTTLAPEFDPDRPLSPPAMAPGAPAPPANPSAELAAVAPPRARTAATIAPMPAPPAPEAPSEEPAAAPSPASREEPRPPAPSPDAAPAPGQPDEAAPPLALATSARPLARRGNIETAAVAPEPEPAPAPAAKPKPAPEAKPKPVPAAKPETEASPSPSDLVRQLREEVERESARRAGATPPTEPTPPSDGARTATSLPSGPPITGAERNGLVLAVQKCWNLPAGLRDAGELKVTVGARLNADGSIVGGSVRLVEPDPAPDARFRQAYEAGRRALLRCAPYSGLPREKYAQWQEIEVVFNPEGMVSW